MRRSNFWLVLALALFALSPTSAVLGAGWSDKPWQVICLDDYDFRSEIECPDYNNEPVNEYYERFLHNVSVWLDSLGFKEPAIGDLSPDEQGDAWLAVLDPENLHIRGTGYDYEYMILSLAHPQARSDTDPVSGLPSDEPQELEDQYELLSTPVRELFLAVMASYQPIHSDDLEKAWIREGMAAAVRTAWIKQSGAYRFVTRLWTSPLDLPISGQADGTGDFWLRVGKDIGSREGIAYFHEVLSQDLQNQTGNVGVDRALQSHGGLSRQLLKFFAWRAKHRGFELFEPHRVSAYLPAGADEKEFRFPVEVRELAGQGVSVKVTTAVDSDVDMGVFLEADHPHLHLIHDGAVLSTNTGYSRNHYRETLPGTLVKTYEFVVANAAPVASESIDRQVELVVNLKKKEEQDCCSCNLDNMVKFSASEGLPCDFRHPAGWVAQYDPYQGRAVVSRPACGKVCTGAPASISFSVAQFPDSNADARVEVFEMIMNKVDSASCGGGIDFYAPRDTEPDSVLGGVQFFVEIEGDKYAGSASFSCPEPGKWKELMLEITGSVSDNPDSTFGGQR